MAGDGQSACTRGPVARIFRNAPAARRAERASGSPRQSRRPAAPACKTLDARASWGRGAAAPAAGRAGRRRLRRERAGRRPAAGDRGADAMSDAAVDAFYDALDGGRFFSTRATVGPWTPSLQHGGPA